MLQLKSSMSAGLEAQRIVITAPPGHGKTTIAASISEFFDPTFSKKVALQDCLWFLFDMGGLDSLTASGVDVPYIDFTRVATEKDLSYQPGSMLMEAIAYAQDQAAKGIVKHLIIDTGSALDRMWHMFGQKKYGKDFGLYDEIISKHNELWTIKLRPLMCNVIMLMHTKAVTESQKKKDQSVANYDWVIDTSGNSGGTYRKHSSLFGVVSRDIKLRGKANEFTLHPYGAFGIEGKCRYPVLQEKEPANLKIAYDKIKASMNSKVA
jgi:hypothetical protein